MPKIVGNEIGCNKWANCAEQSDAPTALDTANKRASVLFKAKRKHNDHDAQLGKAMNEFVGFSWENADVDHQRTEGQKIQHGSQSGFSRQYAGDEYAAPDDG